MRLTISLCTMVTIWCSLLFFANKIAVVEAVIPMIKTANEDGTFDATIKIAGQQLSFYAESAEYLENIERLLLETKPNEPFTIVYYIGDGLILAELEWTEDDLAYRSIKLDSALRSQLDYHGHGLYSGKCTLADFVDFPSVIPVNRPTAVDKLPKSRDSTLPPIPVGFHGVNYSVRGKRIIDLVLGPRPITKTANDDGTFNGTVVIAGQQLPFYNKSAEYVEEVDRLVSTNSPYTPFTVVYYMGDGVKLAEMERAPLDTEYRSIELNRNLKSQLDYDGHGLYTGEVTFNDFADVPVEITIYRPIVVDVLPQSIDSTLPPVPVGSLGVGVSIRGKRVLNFVFDTPDTKTLGSAPQRSRSRFRSRSVKQRSIKRQNVPQNVPSFMSSVQRPTPYRAAVIVNALLVLYVIIHSFAFSS